MARKGSEEELRDKDVVNGDTDAPPDRLHLVYIIFFISGVGTLLPWNFFITATDYFNQRLTSNPDGRAPGALPFDNCLSLCSMLPLAVFSILNFVIMKWISTFTRYLIGSTLIFTIFLITAILVRITMSVELFFGLTLASIVFINIGAAIAQGALFGLASLLPQIQMKGFMEGQAISGVVASLARIISIAAASNWNDSALAYFLIALVFLVIAIVLTLLLRKNAHFKYYRNLEKETKTTGEKEVSSSHEVRSMETLAIEGDARGIISQLWLSVKETWVHGVCIVLTFGVTLTVFPPFTATVIPMNRRPGDEWTEKYFIPVVVFLSFNVFDWLGRFLAGFIKWPRQYQKWILLICCAVRIVLIPLALFMNLQNKVRVPSPFSHDAFPIIYIIVLGLTNGYFVTLALMYGPSYASPGNIETAGMAMSIYVSLGLASGVAVSAILASFV